MSKSLFIKAILFFSLINITQAKETENINEEIIKNFIFVILDKDEEKISEKYLQNSPTFTENGLLKSEIRNFLYGDKGNNGITSIAKKSDIHFKIIHQRENIYLILVTSKNRKDKLEDYSYLQEEWMKSYFACEINLKNEEISFHENVCFSETGGPFQKQY